MKILVTGSKGMLGADIVDVLEKKYAVVALDRSILDITQTDKLGEIMHEIRPSVIVHCAAFTNVDKAESSDNCELLESVNITAVENICKLCIDLKIKLIYPQSFLILNSSAISHDETSLQIQPLGKYANSKLRAEQIIKKYLPKDQRMILRIGGLFGGGAERDKNFIGLFINKILPQAISLHLPEIEVGDRVWQPTWTADVAMLLSHLLSSEWREDWQYSPTDSASFAEIARAILRILGEDRISIKEVSAEKVERGALRPRRIVMTPSPSLEKKWRTHNYEERLYQYINTVWKL
jgi:dTDP-4-dehydrorhamnose reductase